MWTGWWTQPRPTARLSGWASTPARWKKACCRSTAAPGPKPWWKGPGACAAAGGARLLRHQNFPQILLGAGYRYGLPPAGPGLRLPPAHRRHRGRGAAARHGQIRRGPGPSAPRRHRRYPARLAHRRPGRGSDRGLGDSARPGPAFARAGNHFLPHLRAHGNRPLFPGPRRGGPPGHIHGGYQGGGHGCVVNGPGEAREADLGLAGGRDKGVIFRKGEVIRSVKGQEALLAAFMEELQSLLNEKESD